MRYFSKAIPTRPLNTPRGIPVGFEIADDKQPGYLATEDTYLTGELLNAIAGRRGGISEVTELDYAEFVKKKLAWQSLPPPKPDLLQGIRIQPRPQRGQVGGAAAGAAGASPPAPQIEKPPRVEIKTDFPKLGRWRDPTTA